MVSILDIISLVVTLVIIGTIAYYVKKRIDGGKEIFPFLNNGEYCDYCGSKLIKNPMGSTPWNSINYACPKCGYECKRPSD